MKLIDSNNAAPAERSDKQREAARINGAKSHGPVTPDGKRNSSLNALRHNFCSESLVLNNEQKPRYQALLDSYLETFRPSGLVETDLVEQMAAAKWREQRAWTLECATLDYSMDAMRPRLAATIQSTDQATRAALAFSDRSDNSNALGLLHRYEARHARTWRLALKQLRDLQSSKFPNEPGDVVEIKRAV